MRVRYALQSASGNRYVLAPLCAALLAAAVLSACSGGSAWRSSSAMPGDRTGGKVVAAAGKGSQAPAGRGATASTSTDATAADTSGNAGAHGPMPSQTARPEAAAPARQSPNLETPARPDQTLAAAQGGATREPTSPDVGAVDA